MSGRRIIFYILGAFITGSLVLLYMEYNSAKHINTLITANKKLLGEFQITKNLLNVGKSKVVVERKIRGFIESGDTTYLAGLDDEFAEIDSASAYLLTIDDDPDVVSLIHQLDSNVQRKVNLFHKVLNAYSKYGIKTAEDTINANLHEWVSYDIENTVRKITNAREHQLASITEADQKSGKKALEFSYILIALVLLAAALVCWYVIYIIRKQIRSEKKIRDTARIKENFLANMSHEIRTPMNAILGFTQLLSQKKMDEDSRHFVNTIQRSGENLLAIVNDILDISKIEAGMMRIEKVPFSLRGLIHSLEMMAMPKASAKGIRLTVEIEQSIPDMLEGDPVRLTQIIVNLVSNAIKFTAEGSVLFKATSEQGPNDLVTLKIDIRDTGIGIDAQKLQHIFGRFQQADETITRQYGGTGLGLSIVKDLVELQGGTITVESEAGKGTVFHVTIPYTISTRQINDPLAVSELPSPDTRILVTEDNEINQNLLSHIFRSWHIRFDTAANGLEAIEKLKASRYDLILMDIQMPVMDGYTAARKIRNELKSDIPIVAMTAHALPGEKEKCLNHGMNEYMAKPIKQEQLSKLISRFTSFVHPRIEKESDKDADGSKPYQFIQLEYIKDISDGDRNYEKDVTQKFLHTVPLAMQELRHALGEGDTGKMKRIAHNLKTTVSVMGLNELLDPLLDDIESGQTGIQQSLETVERINDICNHAIVEARQFLSSLS